MRVTIIPLSLLSRSYRQNDLSSPTATIHAHDVCYVLHKCHRRHRIVESLSIFRKMCHSFRDCLKKKTYTSVVICEIAVPMRDKPIYYRDHCLMQSRYDDRRESREDRKRQETSSMQGTRGGGQSRSKGVRCEVYGVSSNRRVSAACFNLTSLSASVPSGVARTLLSSRPGHASHRDLISNHPIVLASARFFLFPLPPLYSPSKISTIDFPLVRPDALVVIVQ